MLGKKWGGEGGKRLFLPTKKFGDIEKKELIFLFHRRRSDAQVEAKVQKIIEAADQQGAKPKKPNSAPPPPPQKIVKDKKKSSPPQKPEPTYSTIKKRDISLPLPPQETVQKSYAASMADLNTCGLPDTEMLRRTNSMRNPPPYRAPPQHAYPEHELTDTGARTRANLNQLLHQDIQQLREAAAARGLNEAWEAAEEADTRV